MPQDEISEVEIEAAAWALCADAGGAGKGGCEKDCACWTEARIALAAAAQVRARAQMPAWDAAHNRYYAPVEELAAKIYANFEYSGPGQKPDWTPHGNAAMQDHARALARHQLAVSG